MSANHEEHLAHLSTTSRVEAFSDGVMAIAITLLVLDLKLPSTTNVANGGLLDALLVRWPTYAAYLAAFLTIGIIWLNHHTLIAKIARFDTRLHWLNLVLLLGVATLPFPTSLLAEYVGKGGPNRRQAAVPLLAAVGAQTPDAVVRHEFAIQAKLVVIREKDWVMKDTPDMPIYLGATIVSLFQPLLALALYAAIAALYAITFQGATSPRSVPNPSPRAKGEGR